MGWQEENTYHLNDKILRLKIKTTLVTMITTQVYFPTSFNSEDYGIEREYDSL